MVLKEIDFGRYNLRIQKFFKEIAIETIDELIQFTEDDIFKVKNISKILKKDIICKLATLDKKFATFKNQRNINRLEIKQYYENTKIPSLLIDINESLTKLNNQISILRNWSKRDRED